jgi:transcriptional regulator with XRE-family HTH domain
MTARVRRIERAVVLARTMAELTRREFRGARIASGLSRGDVGRAVGISPSQVDRFERGLLRDVRLEQLCRMCLAVGLVPSLRFFPDADPVRDIAQVRLLDRARIRLPQSIRWRTEVPLQGRGDARAWDAVLDGHRCNDAFEAETRLADLQATERRVMLKFRDDPSVRHVILLVADTKANRRALTVGREGLRGNFPLDTRAAMTSLAAGRCPGGNAVVVL